VQEPVTQAEQPAEQQQPVPVQREMPQRGLLQVFWDRRWIVALATALGLAGGFLYLREATPLYTSTARVYVEQAGPKIITEYEGVMSQSKNYLFTQAELMKSTPIVAAALEQPDMKGLKTFARVDNLVGWLKANLTAEVGKKDDILSVSLDSPYPEEAAQLVNAVVDSYVTYHAKQRRSTAVEVLKILQKEKTTRDEELRAKLKAAMDFKQANPSLSFEDSKGNVIVQRLARLFDALTTAQFETLDAKANYEAIKATADDPEKVRYLVAAQRAKGVFVSTESEEARLRADLENLEQRLAALKQQFTDEALAVRLLKSEIEGRRNRLDALNREFAEGNVAVAEQQYLRAKDKEDQLAQYVEQQRKEAVGLTSQLAGYTLLESDWTRTQKLCDIIDDRIKELHVTEDAGALNISILEVAKAEDKPTSPQPSRVMAIALAIGLMLGGGLALLRDYTDQRLRSTEEISAVLGMPVLGVVPTMSGKDHSIVAHGLAVQKEPRSHAAEAYRTIRTAVYFGVPNGSAKVLLVTSPEAGDGKSTVVSNLGIAMAQAGQRTLIIDADFHKPVQHKIFDLERKQGMSSVLAGREPLDATIRHTAVDGLDVITCGPIPPNPSELLNSKAFADTLRTLSERYDHILVDSPPVMALTDSRILGAMCDVTLLVLRADKSHRNSAQLACDSLMGLGGHILGVIVNAVPRRKDRYYYGGYRYYRYGYRYGYGHQAAEDDKAQGKPTVAEGK
jgi:capsular exopolysaccharide synthesis family protein